MKKVLTLMLLITATAQLSLAQLSPVITSWIINTTGQKGLGQSADTILANVQIVQYNDSNVYISCTCIPGYDVGPFSGNPNVPLNQNFVFKITRSPEQNLDTPKVVGMGHIGIWTNGVSIFNALDGHSYDSDNVWFQNAFYFEGVSFDACLGHPQQNGEYHHHINPKCLYNAADSTHHSPIIGWAFDGFPIYGAYGYADTNGTGGIKRMRSSFQLRNITTRDTLPNGTASSAVGPPVSVQYPLGDYVQDYAFIQGSGDLDVHNGRFCVTPDYPNGIYAYFVTIDSALNAVYPYVLGLTYYGTVQPGNVDGPGSGPPGTSGHNTITGTDTIYNPAAGIAGVNDHIKFELAPNPTAGFTYIYFDPLSINNIKGTLYSSEGKLMRTIENLQPSISYALDMSSYPAGVYFLHLDAGSVSEVQRIVKTK